MISDESMIIKYTTLKRSLYRRVVTRYEEFEEVKPEYPHRVKVMGERVVFIPKGTEVFRYEHGFGSSGAKDIKHFLYLGDLIEQIHEEVGDRHSFLPFWYSAEDGGIRAKNFKTLVLALTALMDGALSRIIVKRDGRVLTEPC